MQVSAPEHSGRIFGSEHSSVKLLLRHEKMENGEQIFRMFLVSNAINLHRNWNENENNGTDFSSARSPGDLLSLREIRGTGERSSRMNGEAWSRGGGAKAKAKPSPKQKR